MQEKQPSFKSGDLVTRTIRTSIVLVFEIDEVLESGDTFLYHLKPYKEAGDRNGIWEKEDGLRKATRKGLVEKIQDAVTHARDVAAGVEAALKPGPFRVCDALCQDEVLQGLRSVVVDLDGTPAVEYHFKPDGAVRVLHMRNLDLGIDKSQWTPSVPTDQALMAPCRTTPYPPGENIIKLMLEV